MQIIPRKWKASQKKNKYILISLNFCYKREELCPALIYWDPFVRIHQGSIIKCVDVYCFFNYIFSK